MRGRNLLLVGTLLVASWWPADARAAISLEYQVKAAFLYNFAKFVTWPEEAFSAPDAPFVFCIVGHDPFGEGLEKVLSGRKAGGRRIVVRRGPDPESVGRCHLMFIGATEDAHVARHLRAVSAQPVLTVGESEAFARAGGIIRLVVADKRVRFDINQKAAEDARLRLSSQLLKLARHVTR
ncbi:MAG: YfiR family protein [Candidatus Dadabacteria bacterium]|nr:MAG: YfiR family protein [Candidatus Dadabacteria bacterium]